MSDGIPKTFQLAGHKIKVRIISKKDWPHGRKAVGMWMPDFDQIDILNSKSVTNRQQVFMHEMLHALLDVACHHEISENEILVDRLAHLLQQAFTTFE